MKKKLSISVEEETDAEINRQLSEGKFRNKSHFIEYAVQEYLRGKND